MPEQKKRCVVLGVTGGIAAYKAADLCSKLVQSGYDVHVIMTAAALELVTERTFFTLSRNPVTVSLWDVPVWQPEHIALAERAELLVVAPCTANFIGKYAHGIADDALTTFALAHTGKVLLAPAMNPRMWNNVAVQDNLKLLQSRCVEFVGPEAGRVACGDDGLGRMAEPEAVLEKICQLI
ncbi:flavoprotein [Lentisphaerota bacterium ZTH]|nr:phosphopantothenoylcysteine decarboxylase [Lentisphaerota bacterium]WET05995.1 flavoprotein [Lentisphaerota bacterium ZTH]